MATEATVLEPRVVGPVDESELPSEQETAMRASEAKWVSTHDVEPDEDPGKVQEPPATGQAPGELELPEKFKGKSVAEIVKSYTELEAHSTRLATENSELKKRPVGESQAQQQEPVKKPLLSKEKAKELGEKLFNNAEEAIAEIISLAQEGAVQHTEAKASAKSHEDQITDVRKWFTGNHADLAKNRSAMLMIEGLAGEAEGSGMLEKFQNATKTYLEIVNASAIKAETGAKGKATETLMQVDKAAMPVQKKAAGNGRKVWKESDIQYLMEHDMSQYQRLQNEIVKARKEGRVRNDL